MADAKHLELLKQGVDLWNEWRAKEPSIVPDFSEAKLDGRNLSQADLNGAYLRRASLMGTDLSGANLTQADLAQTTLFDANFRGANLSQANLNGAHLPRASLMGTDLSGATLNRASLVEANLVRAILRGADLRRANLSWANFLMADLSGTNFVQANLAQANLSMANLRGADLSRANLHGAILVEANLGDAVLAGSYVYGVSAWNAKLNDSTKQQNLVITRQGEPEVTVDNIEVAQFVYLLLHSKKIRDVIDTIGLRGVLLLGRFSEGRIVVLERLREELRKRGYLPIVFNFDKPETKDFTETVRLLAGLSHFVIADITSPKSVPLELQATVDCMVPFLPIIEEGERPFSMFQDLWIKYHDWVFPPIHYSSLNALVGALDEKIIRPAEVRFAELLARKAEKMKEEHV